ncbi:MAG: molybdenum cofactor biosynthesis protein MoaE [Bryobacter sp.]
MTIRVLFFGQLKDIADPAEVLWTVNEGATVATLFAELAERYPQLEGLAGSIAVARNQSFARPDDVLVEGDEIALLPPVSGGTQWLAHEATPEGHFFGITREPLDTEALKRRLVQGHDGAVAIFEGLVRNNTKGRPTLYLDYEAYEGMALKVMADLGRELAAEHGVSRIGLLHRLGRLEIGEASVVVCVTSPHREAAIAAAHAAINRLKRTVPIWKKEYFADGEVWVEGAWEEGVPRLA